MIFFLLLGAFGHWSSGPYIINNATALTKETLHGLLVWPLSTYLWFSWLVKALKLSI